jgi:hypothetical protein
MTRKWTCSDLNTGCPPQAPTIGNSCTAAGLTCNYGYCQGVGDAFQCGNGAWESYSVTCPG